MPEAGSRNISFNQCRKHRTLRVAARVHLAQNLSHINPTACSGETGVPQPPKGDWWRQKTSLMEKTLQAHLRNGRLNNPTRGFRSGEATERRRIARTTRRWASRRLNRNTLHPTPSRDLGPSGAQEETSCRLTQAPVAPKFSYGQDLKFATLNIRGTRVWGKRQEVSKWMEQDNIDVLLVQETHESTTKMERRPDVTWYFGGNDKTNASTRAWP